MSHDLHDVILQLYMHNEQNGENKVQWNQHNTHMQTQRGTFHDCLYYRPSEKMPQTLFY